MCLLLISTFSIVVSGTKCPELSLCFCSENVYSDYEVNCHGVKGIGNIVCSICDKIKNVTTLDLSGTKTISIPSSCFKKCPNLKKLNLMSNSIQTLSNDSLNGLKNLENLNLYNNMLLQSSEISSFEVLKTLDNLDNLSMRNNSRSSNLTSYNICPLCGFLRNVTVLDLSENVMNHVPPSCFGRCSTLEELYLESNNISEVDNSSFDGLATLKVLNLDNNGVILNGNISHPDLFEPLHSLQELHVQKNTNTRNGNMSFSYLSNIGNSSLNNLKTLFLDSERRW